MLGLALTVCVLSPGQESVEQSTPGPVARATLDALLAGHVADMHKLYHVESETMRGLVKLREATPEQYELLIDYAGQAALILDDVLKLSYELSEPEMVGEIAQIVVKLKSGTDPEFAMDLTMQFKQGTKAGGGTGWFIWDDGLHDLFALTEQDNAEIAKRMGEMRQELQGRSEVLVEAREADELKAAGASVEACAQAFWERLKVGDTPAALELLHPDAPLAKTFDEAKGKYEKAPEVYARFASRVLGSVVTGLGVRVELGAPAESGEEVHIPWVIRMEKYPDFKLETVAVLRTVVPAGAESPAWRIWNADELFDLFEKAAGADQEVKNEVEGFREEYGKRLSEHGTEFGPAAPVLNPEDIVDRGSPESVIQSYLVRLISGDMKGAHALFHPDSEHAKQYSKELDAAASDPAKHEVTLAKAGELFKAIFVSLRLTPKIEDVKTDGDTTEAKVRLVSGKIDGLVVEQPVKLRKLGEATSQAPNQESNEKPALEPGWYLWETELFPALYAAIEERDPEFAEQIKKMQEEMAAESAPAAQDAPPAEAPAESSAEASETAPAATPAETPAETPSAP